MKLYTIVGARPQFIKAATVSRRIRDYENIDETIIHTGQHYDKNINEIFFEELNIPLPKYNLNIGSGQHGIQTAKMLSGIEEILLQDRPDCVLVYGDTNSTIAGALAAVKLHIPVAHVEAGLRSFNRLMPEEINRIVTDSVSDVLFAPTQNAVDQLKKEGRGEAVVFSGDVMFDSVQYYKKQILKRNQPASHDPYYLCTIHRAENTDDPDKLKAIFKAFSMINQKIILPLHPRTKHILKNLEIKIPDNLHIIDPVGYMEMLSLLLHSEKMITDSGGVQKEAYFLHKPCITLRNETEWIETLDHNWNILCGTDSEKIVSAVESAVGEQTNLSAFGNGDSAAVIIQSVIDKFNR